MDSRELVELFAPLETIRDIPWLTAESKMPELKRTGNREYIAEVEEMLEEVKPNVIVASDGSIRDGVTAWGGTVWRDRRIVYKWSAAKHGSSSSFQK